MCSHPNGKIADQEESDDLSTGLRSVLQWQWISFNFMADNDCDNIYMIVIGIHLVFDNINENAPGLRCGFAFLRRLG